LRRGKRTHDWQVDEVYSWEWKFRHWWIPHLSLKGCRNWIDWACARYDIEPPKVKKLNEGTHAGDYHVSHVIRINPNHYSLTTSLHEAAHAIAFKLDEDLSHDKLWMGIYIDLLVSARVAPRIALEASAEDEGLRFMKNANPARVKRAQKKKARKY
jgi:hypothetical protein